MPETPQNERMSIVSPAEEKSLWLAQLVSRATNPLYIAPPVLLIIALIGSSDFWQGLLWWAVSVAGVSLAPYLLIRGGVRSGRYSDFHVSRREQRLIPFLLGIVCVGLTMLVLLGLNASSAYIGTMTALIASLVAALGITQLARWKISLHLIGISGAVTALALIGGSGFAWLAPLIPLVGWARWKVRAHTPMQACAGALLAIGVTVGVFALFGRGP